MGRRVGSGTAALLTRMSIRPKRPCGGGSSGTQSLRRRPARRRHARRFPSPAPRRSRCGRSPPPLRRAQQARGDPSGAPRTGDDGDTPAKSAFSIRRIVLPCLSFAHVHERRDQGTRDNDAGPNGTQGHRPQARSNSPRNQKVDRRPARGSLHRLVRHSVLCRGA